MQSSSLYYSHGRCWYQDYIIILLGQEKRNLILKLFKMTVLLSLLKCWEKYQMLFSTAVVEKLFTIPSVSV